MAGPEDWGAQPVVSAAGPEAWGAQPQQQDEGLLAKGIGMLQSPEGRAQLWQGAQKLPADILKGTLDWFETPGKAYQQGITSDEEVGFGLNTALGTMGEGAFKVPPEITRITIPLAKQFQDGVLSPAAQRLDSYARVGDPNGVWLEPPAPDVVPSQIKLVVNSPFAGVPRSIAAKTGIPEVDGLLNSERPVLDNAVVDRTRDIPNSWGGDKTLNNPTTYVDHRFPKEMTVDGVTFDTAEPAIIHENIEHKAIQLLTDAGMEPDAALRVAYWGWGNPAEHAWYTAHGMNPDHVEAALRPILDKIATEKGSNVPSDLFRGTYPDGDPQKASAGNVPKPTPEEAARGMDIIRNAPELRPKSTAPMLQQARELGVIGEDRPSLNELPPKEAGQQAMAAAQPPGPKITGPEPEGGMTPWRQRWERTLDKMQTPADARQLISAAVDANDEFMEARQGNMSAGQVEQLASVTGLDSAKIDVAGTSAKIKTNAEIRNTINAFRGINDKIVEAARNKDAEEFTRLELQRDLLLHTAVSSKEFVALRAEFGRIGNTIQEFMTAHKDANAFKEFLKDNGKTVDDVNERMRAIEDTPPNLIPGVLEKTRGPQRPGWFFWLYQQGLISGLITHTKYAIVNTGTLMLERSISPEVAALIGKARGERVSAVAPLYANVAMLRAVPDAFASAGQAFKSGLRVPLGSEIELAKRGVENPEAVGAAKSAYTQPGPDWGIWKRVFNETQLAKAADMLGIPGKSANMLHTFYKVLSENASAGMRAYEAAFQDGAKGDAFWDRYNYHRANPSDEALQASVDDAYSGAFMEKLGENSAKVARILSTNPVLKWAFPFQHIPWNIERKTLSYTPAPLVLALLKKGGLVDTKMGSAILGELGHPAQNLALAKVAVGTSIIGYFINKGLAGTATGDYPIDPNERREWQLTGKQPNSVQIGDQWVSEERLGPAGNLVRLGGGLGAVINRYDGKDDEGLLKAIWAGAMVGANQISDETGFQFIRNVLDVIEGRQDPARFLSWQAGALMYPSSLVSQFASFEDPYMRQANSLLDGLKYRIPSQRETLLPKRDPLYGEPVPNPGYHAVLRESPVNTDPVKAELDRIGYFPTAPQKHIGGVKLTPEQYDKYEATAGPLVKQMLSAAIQTPAYRRADIRGQKAWVKGLIEAGRAKARAAVQMSDPALIQAGIDARTAAIHGQ